MTEGTIWKVLIGFAFPLFLGNLFQQMYNAVDSLVVGNFCGDDALAAVSSSGSLCLLIIGFFQGTFTGASVMISRFFGAREEEKLEKAVHTTILFSLGIGLVLSLLGVWLTPTILRWMGTPETVLPNSILYFRIYCAGLLSLVLYNTMNGIFQALGDSRHPLCYLILASLANVGLDLLFVAVLDWGVAGAAAATIIGQSLSAILGFAHLMSGRFFIRVSLQKLRPDPALLKQIFRLGLPSGIQNSVISIANVLVQSNINTFGKAAMAGCGSYAKIEGFAFLPIISLSLAITTFISQNLGAGKRERVKTGARLGIVMMVGLAELVGLATFLFAPLLIGLFSPSPDVVVYGILQARVVSLAYCLLAFSHAAGAVLRGAGKTLIPMVIMLCVWCVFRIFYVTLMVRLIPSILVVFTAYPITWSISSLLFFLILRRGNWLDSSLARPVEKEAGGV